VRRSRVVLGDGASRSPFQARVKAVLVGNTSSDGITIFVVRGCDEEARQRLNVAFRQLGLEPKVFEFVPF
jgi:hypothetical protein